MKSRNQRWKQGMNHIIIPIITAGFGILCLSAIFFSASDYLEGKINHIVWAGNPVKIVLKENDTIKVPKWLPDKNSLYGTISCEKINLSAPLYYGNSPKVLQYGAGQYVGSAIPGDEEPILISAYDSTFFSPLNDIKTNDVITVNTIYGTYYYQVQSIEIKEAYVESIYNLNQDKEELILYTCYPFGELTKKGKKSLFVYCERAERENR